MTSSSYAHQLTLLASTKRNAVVNGAKTGYASYLTAVSISPLCPVEFGRGEDLRRSMKLDSAFRLLECFSLASFDIQGNDILTVAGRDYYVRAVMPWDFHGETRTNIILEDVRQ